MPIDTATALLTRGIIAIFKHKMNQDLEASPKSYPLVPILITVLGLTTVLFAGLFLLYFSQATTAKSTLSQAKKAAADSARSEQKKADIAASELAQEVPFRSYQAPEEFGSFNVKFPKNWSARLAESTSSQIQVNLSINPDFVRYKDDSASPWHFESAL